MSWRVWTWLLSLSVLWGGAFFFAKVAMDGLGPFTVVFGRVALAALALNLVLAVSPSRRLGAARPWRAYFCMGLLNNVIPFSLFNAAQLHISSGLASILNATTPLFTLMVAHALTSDEKINARKILALVCGLAGVAVLIGPSAMSEPGSAWGELACLAAALSYAFAGVYGRRFPALGSPPVETAAGQVTASSLLILPLVLVVEPPW